MSQTKPNSNTAAKHSTTIHGTGRVITNPEVRGETPRVSNVPPPPKPKTE